MITPGMISETQDSAILAVVKRINEGFKLDISVLANANMEFTIRDSTGELGDGMQTIEEVVYWLEGFEIASMRFYGIPGEDTPTRIIPLTKHDDPGHGWLEVPVELVNELGITEHITPFSWMSLDKSKWYLEEDCDMGIFMRAAKAKNWDVAITHKNYDEEFESD